MFSSRRVELVPVVERAVGIVESCTPRFPGSVEYSAGGLVTRGPRGGPRPAPEVSSAAGDWLLVDLGDPAGTPPPRHRPGAQVVEVCRRWLAGVLQVLRLRPSRDHGFPPCGRRRRSRRCRPPPATPAAPIASPALLAAVRVAATRLAAAGSRRCGPAAAALASPPAPHRRPGTRLRTPDGCFHQGGGKPDFNRRRSGAPGIAPPPLRARSRRTRAS